MPRSATKENCRNLAPEKPGECRFFPENRAEQAVEASGHEAVELFELHPGRQGFSAQHILDAQHHRRAGAQKAMTPRARRATDKRLSAELLCHDRQFKENLQMSL